MLKISPGDSAVAFENWIFAWPCSFLKLSRQPLLLNYSACSAIAMIPRKRWHLLENEKSKGCRAAPEKLKPRPADWFDPAQHGRSMLFIHACKTGKKKFAARLLRKLQSYLPRQKQRAERLLESIHWLMHQPVEVQNKLRC